MKYGALQRAAFAEPGGERTARLDRRLPEPALRGADLQGGASGATRLMETLGDQGDVSRADRAARPMPSSPR